MCESEFNSIDTIDSIDVALKIPDGRENYEVEIKM